MTIDLDPPERMGRSTFVRHARLVGQAANVFLIDTGRPCRNLDPSEPELREGRIYDATTDSLNRPSQPLAVGSYRAHGEWYGRDRTRRKGGRDGGPRRGTPRRGTRGASAHGHPMTEDATGNTVLPRRHTSGQFSEKQLSAAVAARVFPRPTIATIAALAQRDLTRRWRTSSH